MRIFSLYIHDCGSNDPSNQNRNTDNTLRESQTFRRYNTKAKAIRSLAKCLSSRGNTRQQLRLLASSHAPQSLATNFFFLFFLVPRRKILIDSQRNYYVRKYVRFNNIYIYILHYKKKNNLASCRDNKITSNRSIKPLYELSILHKTEFEPEMKTTIRRDFDNYLYKPVSHVMYLKHHPTG